MTFAPESEAMRFNLQIGDLFMRWKGIRLRLRWRGKISETIDPGIMLFPFIAASLQITNYLPIDGFTWILIDVLAGRKALDPDSFSPTWNEVCNLIRAATGAVVKIAPATKVPDSPIRNQIPSSLV